MDSSPHNIFGGVDSSPYKLSSQEANGCIWLIVAMSNQPRKFSEKIAMLNQKQSETDAAFQEIMKSVTEVKVTSNNLSGATHQYQLDESLRYRNTGPGVNAGIRERGRTGGSVGSGGPIRSSRSPADRADKRKDSSPYASVLYLSPPSDLSWRRTASDSALHQSSVLPNTNLLHSPGSQRRATASHVDSYGNYGVGSPSGSSSRLRQLVAAAGMERRPRSCCSLVPNINVSPSQQESLMEIPTMGNNGGGSLPDLSNFQFNSPLGVGLDQDDRGYSPAYSPASSNNSPQHASPSTLSPTSRGSGAGIQYTFCPNVPNYESPGPPASSSPLLSPSGSALQHIKGRHLLTVPYGSGRHHPRTSPTQKGFAYEGGTVTTSDPSASYSQPQQQQQQRLMYQQQQQQQMHLPNQHYTFGNFQTDLATPMDPSFANSQAASRTNYRNPNQASPPISLPNSSAQQRGQYSSSRSPLSSAPQSPSSSGYVVSSSSPSSSTSQYYLNQASPSADSIALQQHFEQIRMEWDQLLEAQTLLELNLDLQSLVNDPNIVLLDSITIYPEPDTTGANGVGDGADPPDSTAPETVTTDELFWKLDSPGSPNDYQRLVQSGQRSSSLHNGGQIDASQMHSTYFQPHGQSDVKMEPNLMTEKNWAQYGCTSDGGGNSDGNNSRRGVSGPPLLLPLPHVSLSASSSGPNTPSTIPDIILTDFSSAELQKHMSKDLDLSSYLQSSSQDGSEFDRDIEELMLSTSDDHQPDSSTSPDQRYSLDSLNILEYMDHKPDDNTYE